ncbi:helix-turn-helix domain-containing protein [Gemmobacter serpentinus]|uniref:helix-turn-helix domain-containing protein n=1 Tax=Gemmobacter serpentinus TaxID=2652247 RepID=UPI0018658603|nr:helix-turn-helix domain-containing protein [Gemmobacter serpentinus]
MGAFVPLLLKTMESPAWLSLTTKAKALYPLLVGRSGKHREKNGAFFLSVREAAEYLNLDKNTAGKAMQELQAKGFLIAEKVGVLGVEGVGRATVWRLTEFASGKGKPATREFDRWSEGNDFLVQMGRGAGKKPV